MFKHAIIGLVGLVTTACGGVALQPTATPAATPVPTSTPTAAPTASPSPSPSPKAISDPQGPLEPGVYVAHPFAGSSMSFTFTVGSDHWASSSDPGQMRGIVWVGDGGAQDSGIGLGFLRVSSFNRDGCQWAGTDDDWAIGPSVDALVNKAVSAQLFDTPALEVTMYPVDLTLGGYSGQYVQVSLPDSDFSACDEGRYRIWNAEGFDIYAQGPSNRWGLTVLDVEGERVVLLTSDFASTTSSIESELWLVRSSVSIAP